MKRSPDGSGWAAEAGAAEDCPQIEENGAATLANRPAAVRFRTAWRTALNRGMVPGWERVSRVPTPYG